MKRRLRLRRRGISAPSLTIRSAPSWRLRLAFFLLATALVTASIWYVIATRMAPPTSAPAPPTSNHVAAASELAQLRQQLMVLQDERARQPISSGSAESQLTMMRSMQKQLAEQVRLLETENVKLKEDLAFFEKLLPLDAKLKNLAIRQLKTELVTATQLHYQVLVMQGLKSEHEFAGNLQIVVGAMQAGKTVTLVFPSKETPAEGERFRLAFRQYQRLQGSLTLPEGVVVKTVQARILEGGQVRAQETARL